MAATTASHHFSIIDNSALDSSMDSTQGLLSFMSNASRQIKTYLGPEQQKNNIQSKNRHQQLLLQLSHLKTQNYNFIPNILETSEHSADSLPASPTPSLDSIGSHDERDGTPASRTSCLIKSRNKRQRGTTTVPGNTKTTPCNEVTKKRPRYNNNRQQTINTCAYNALTKNAPYSTPYAHSYENTIPSPSPDFEDLVDCMITEDALASIDVNNYFSSL